MAKRGGASRWASVVALLVYSAILVAALAPPGTGAARLAILAVAAVLSALLLGVAMGKWPALLFGLLVVPIAWILSQPDMLSSDDVSEREWIVMISAVFVAPTLMFAIAIGVGIRRLYRPYALARRASRPSSATARKGVQVR